MKLSKLCHLLKPLCLLSVLVVFVIWLIYIWMPQLISMHLAVKISLTALLVLVCSYIIFRIDNPTGQPKPHDPSTKKDD